MSPIDVEARTRYQAYTEARERMLSATHTAWAPWTLVDFNDQSVGRLTLLRDLLDRLPDTQLPVPEIPWPPLQHEPLKEQSGVLKPIPTLVVGRARGGSESATGGPALHGPRLGLGSAD